MESFISNNETSSVGFDVDVNDAVQLLGVSRTRLSQLVSKGVLGYERRRVDTRLRMYFNRTELLGYVRRQLSGASARVKHNEWALDAEPAESRAWAALPDSSEKTDISEEGGFSAYTRPTSFSRHERQMMPQKVLKSALEWKEAEHERHASFDIRELEKMHKENVIQSLLSQNKALEILQSKMRENLFKTEKRMHQLEEKLDKYSKFRALEKAESFKTSTEDDEPLTQVKKKLKTMSVKRKAFSIK